MGNESIKNELLAKEEELSDYIRRLEQEARESQTSEVEDPIDRVNSATAKAAQFEEISRASSTLAQVRAALQRMDEGSYGRCVDCGRPIEADRLEAVPWTAYCKIDQIRHDQARGAAEGQAGD